MQKLSKRQWAQVYSLYKKTDKKSSVYNIYKTCSYDKQAAEDDIKREMKKQHGWGYRVIGHNCQSFSCVYRTSRKLVYLTPWYRYTEDIAKVKEYENMYA